MKTRVFISYSHEDWKFVDDEHSYSILKFIKGLENEINVEFWHDKGKVSTGDLWDAEIQKAINDSKMAICLVSNSFLQSQYITNVEIAEFMKKRDSEGMRIYPIILSDCEWEQYDWLNQTQFTPLNGKNLEQHFLSNAGKRKAKYTEIKRELRSLLNKLNPKSNRNDSTLPYTKKLIQNSDDEVTLEVADKFMDTGDYITAKNLFLGSMSFEDIPFQEQLNVLIIEQKYGLISDAKRHLKYLFDNNLINIPKEQIALLNLVRLKVQSQAHDYKKVISIFPSVVESLINTKQEVRASSAFNRTGIAYAALGDIDNSKKCLLTGHEIAKRYREIHLEITSKMYQSAAQFFCGTPCGLDNPLEQLTKCQSLYFKNPINKNNVILWQTYNFKSIVQCLFAEAAILLAKGKRERSYIRMTAANLLSPIARSNPKAEGYSELLATINQKGINNLVEVAMYPDEKHKDMFQKNITSISSYLKQLQKVIPDLYHSPDLKKWQNLRNFFNEFDKRYS